MEKSIKYQNFSMRVFSFVPVIFLLACIEYEILNKILSDIGFFLVSTILMMFFVGIYFKCSDKMFLEEASYIIQGKGIHIIKRKKTIQLDFEQIQEIKIRKIDIYGVSVAKLTIDYDFNYKSRTLVFYSRDLINEPIEKQELWDFYNELNQAVSGL